jgi:hypothetical protein
MPASSSRTFRFWVIVAAAATGGLLTHTLVRPFVPNPPARVRVLPYPHHVPKSPGGVSLRFAMVQDVLTERYAHHGRAYYLARNRVAREDLARLPPGGPWDAASDDLAAGLDGLGDQEGAVRVMREKLASQTERGVADLGLYATYANLGTFLIHGNLRSAQAGDTAARDQLGEGLGFIQRAIAVNPDAHFGREQWQVAAIEFLIAASEKQELLRTFDLIGNRLDADIDPRERRVFGIPSWTAGGAHIYGSRFRQENALPRDETLVEYIQHVGAEYGWPANLIASNPKPVPFDEPVLGVVGMWREGGGPNSHFALCLGEVMLRVGQRYLAWTAFERATRLADDYWPGPELQQFLRDHCRKRQAMIEAQLSAEEVAQLRPQFDAELAYGQRYQQEYGEYEAEQIAAGRLLDDTHFYDDFHAGRPPIASPVGPEDELRVISEIDEWQSNWLPGPRAGYAVFGMGLGAFGAALWMRGRLRRVDAAPPADL